MTASPRYPISTALNEETHKALESLRRENKDITIQYIIQRGIEAIEKELAE